MNTLTYGITVDYPNSTLVVDGGQIILGQSQSLSVYVSGFTPVAMEGIRYAFGWSEDIIP